MIDHLNYFVKDVARSRAFFQKALAPLGYALIAEFEPPEIGKVCGFGVPPKPDFWIAAGPAYPRVQHIAFRAASRAEVDAFYAAAIAAGGKDNGPPGLRPRYHANYYGAFVFDPDGHNIEAVHHG